MFRLILIFIVLGFILYGVHKFKKNKHKIDKPLILKITTGILLILCLMLVVTGRAHWIAALAAGVFALLQRVIPLLIRLFPFLHGQYRKHQTGKLHEPNLSEVSTDILRMTLDHDSGQLDGEVLWGEFKDKQLSDLEKEQLEQLYVFCLQQDEESVQLLDNYMQKRFGDEWSSQAGDEGDAEYSRYENRSNSSDMLRSEALSILALNDDATEEEVIQAHRKLIQKLHPDRGGSDYLAAKVNEAKRVLLGK